MNSFRRGYLACVVLAIALLPAAKASDAEAPLTEDAAISLLDGKLKHDANYRVECDTYQTEKTNKAYFEFALRDHANAKCGGDPGVEPVVARFRVYRQSRKIRAWEPTTDTWPLYKPGHYK